jgi:protein-disulfide isomerase
MPFYVLLGVVALVGAGVLLYQLFGRGDLATEPVAVEIDPAELSRVQGVAIGEENAPVVIYEFADFQCPGCGQYATFVMPLVKERLVQEGLVRYVYYDFPLTSIHEHAFLASRAGRCANEQGRFWEYHDLLYARQPRWASARNAADLFVDYAAELGLDRAAFASCLRSDRFADEVTRSLRLGESLGVQGTPTIFINGKRLPQIPSFQQLEQIVREEAGAPAAGGAQQPAAPETAAPEASSGS